MNIEGNVLTVGDVEMALAPVHLDAVVKVWEVPIGYRASGLFVAVNLPGTPEEVPACSPADARYLGSIEYTAQEASRLIAAKAAKLVELNAACERALGELSSSYPPGELQSWPQQVQEAEALRLDPPGAAPLLTVVADTRGVPLQELAQRVREKAVAYAEFSGAIIGKRQRLEDQLNAAATLVAVGAIAW